MEKNISQLQTVVEKGYCVGCGTCSFALGSKMNINDYGEYVPDLDYINNPIYPINKITTLCPSLHPELNENVIGKKLFAAESHFNESIGYVQSSYAAFVNEGDFRKKGTSGGMGTWIATELLRLGLIDGVIHVKESKRENSFDPFFRYGISRTPEEIQQSSKTRYHVVEVSGVLELVNKFPGRYLFIGVPCISKSIRRLQLLDPVFSERIPFVVSLVCGHLKSINWSLALSWGVDISPDNAAAIQYRTKEEGIPARAYVFRATSKNSEVKQQDSSTIVGGKFNAGAMMLPACDFCDDVVGETADLTIGDAWIPKFEVDSGGTNLLIVRNTVIHDLLKSAAIINKIMLTEISDTDAANSQSGGFRQRREGLSYRLEQAKAKNEWIPIKRLAPGQIELSQNRKKIYEGRREITINSREFFKLALEKNDYSFYTKGMLPLLKKVRAMELRSSFFRLALNKIKRVVLKFINK